MMPPTLIGSSIRPSRRQRHSLLIDRRSTIRQPCWPIKPQRIVGDDRPALVAVGLLAPLLGLAALTILILVFAAACAVDNYLITPFGRGVTLANNKGRPALLALAT